MHFNKWKLGVLRAGDGLCGGVEGELRATRMGGEGGLLTGGEINELWDEKLESTETYGEGAVWHRDEDGWALSLPVGWGKRCMGTGA